MRHKKVIRIIVFALVLIILLSCCSCANKSSSIPVLDMDVTGRENQFSFASQPSEVLSLSEEGAASVLSVIENQQADYSYAYLYDLDEVQKRLSFDATVESHRYNALNGESVLDTAHLVKIVEENNAKYLELDKFGYENVDSEYLQELCDFIVQTINHMSVKYPEVDWQRVYCNLGNLKILYDVGMLSYAEVSHDLVLAISKNNTEIVLNMKGENGFRNVLIHEIMHIIQIGCECEQIEHCERRCGISVYWDDFPLNTTDWGWFFEGSAERNMCNLTGEDAISYQYKMDYLCSYTLSVLLREDVDADTMETISFFSDPELLFDAFGCQTTDEREEILKLMITTNVLQMQPDAFYEVYKAATGEDLKESDETLNNFSYSLKPSICVTLAKEFYENLVIFMQEEQVPANDLFFLLTLFEGHLNQHLKYSDQSKLGINKPFVDSYISMRTALFDAIEIDNSILDMDELYEAYNIIALGEGMLNADVSTLPADKRAFLAERAEWQDELNGLGVKILVH